MLEGYIVGTLSTLISVIVGFILGKPYLDRWQSRKHQKHVLKLRSAQKPKSGGTTP